MVYTIRNHCDEVPNLPYNDGADKMNQLIILLSEADRVEDILKAAKDTAYRNILFKEYNL